MKKLWYIMPTTQPKPAAILESMRILFLSHRYTDTKIGGLAEFLHYLPPALQTLDIESTIYTQAENDSVSTLTGPEILPNGIKHYSGPFLKPKLFPAKKELAPLIELCKKEKIDLIHAQGTYRAGYMARAVQKQLGIPYIVTSHSDILSLNSQRMQKRSVLRRCRSILKDTAGVTHLTPMMQKASHAICDTSTKNAIIHNGIDIDAWQPYQSKTEQDYMLAIGRLVPEKGFGFLINAFKKLKESNTSTSIVIAGTGSAQESFIQQARDLGLNVVLQPSTISSAPNGSVIFTGYTYAETKKTLFSEAKLVLFATQPAQWEEAFGIVLLEAMAAGKPIIASDINSTRYLINQGMHAEIVQPDDTNAWADAMQRLLNNTQLRITAGKQNSQNAAQFDWRLIAAQYKNIYLACKQTKK